MKCVTVRIYSWIVSPGSSNTLLSGVGDWLLYCKSVSLASYCETDKPAAGRDAGNTEAFCERSSFELVQFIKYPGIFSMLFFLFFFPRLVIKSHKILFSPSVQITQNRVKAGDFSAVRHNSSWSTFVLSPLCLHHALSCSVLLVELLAKLRPPTCL